MKRFVQVIRVITGLLFIFSGLVKANDPLGLVYKTQEFMGVLHLDSLAGMAKPFSMGMIVFEVLAGVAILVGFRLRIFAPLILALGLFFAFLTGYAFFSGKIKECGCFGDCIPLSAGASFAKDVVLLILILIIFAARKSSPPFFSSGARVLIMILGLLTPIVVQGYAINHLPPVDCLPYAVGKNILKEMQPPPGAVPDQYETQMIYERNGIRKAFTMENYPWKDTSWHFVSRSDKLVRAGNAIPVIEDFAIFDFGGHDITKELLEFKGLTFFLMVKDVNEAGKGWATKMDSLQQSCYPYGIRICGITASPRDQALVFSRENNLHFPFFQMDGTVIKTAARSNPCLLLMSGGTVLGKWHFHDFPDRIIRMGRKGLVLHH